MTRLTSAGVAPPARRHRSRALVLALALCSAAASSCDARQGSVFGAEVREGEWAQVRQAVCLTEPPADPPCTAGDEILIPYPQGTNYTDFTLLASDLLEVRDITVTGAVASLGLADTVIFSGATIEDLYSRGLVDLRSGATVTGEINTTTDIAVQGSANYNPALVDINYPFDPEQTESLCFAEPSDINTADNIFIDVQQTKSYPPGTYNDVELRNDATLILTPGVYWLDWIQVEPNSVFQIDTTGCTENCSVVFNIRSELAIPLRGSVQPPNSDFVILYHGTLPVTLNSAFDGFIVAMNAVLRINNNEPHVGAFFARQVYAEAGQTITNRPFPLDSVKSWQP